MWVLGFLISDEPVQQTAEHYTAPSWCSNLVPWLHSLKLPAYPLDQFLLPEEFINDDDDDDVDNDGAVLKQDKKVSKKSDNKDKKDKDRKDIFKVDHLQFYESAALTWPPAYDSDPAFATAAKKLTVRMGQCAWALHKLFPVDQFPQLTIHDLHMNIKWLNFEAHLLRSVCPCLVATTVPWVRNQMRVLQGGECLSLQGMDYGVQNIGPEFTRGQLIDLAGNAFNGFVVQAAMIAMFANIDWDVVGRRHGEQMSSDVDLEEEQEEEDEEEEADSLFGSGGSDSPTMTGLA